MSRWAAVLAGGSGTRFWPLSTPDRPKQLLALSGDRPLLVETVRRLEGLVAPERILVVTGRALVESTREVLPWLPPDNVLGEPTAASTAPALAWVTARAQRHDPEASVLSLHADWHVGDDTRFRETGEAALDTAERHDVLVTVGVGPRRPEIGYGYIVPGDALDRRARRVERFVEKPDIQQATRLIAQGALWNSGLFAWTAARFFAETERVAPEVAPHLHLLRADDVLGFFSAVTPVAVDVSHLERSRRVAVIPGQFDWDDVGNWGALARVRRTDERGNVTVGAAVIREASDCVVWADSGSIVVDGVRDLVVVQANGVVLVTTKARSADLKHLLEQLPDEIRHIGR